MTKPSLKFTRRTVQIGVAAAFVAIPILNRWRIDKVYGNFLSFSAAGVPLADPLAALQVTVTGWVWPRDLWIGAAIALVLALGLGAVFCSWVCPFGLLSEWMFELGQRVLPQKYEGWKTRSNGFPLKAGIFSLGLLAVVFFFGSPVLSHLSMPGWYSRIFQMWFLQQHVSLAIGLILLVLLAEFLARNRFWCRYICPQAFLLTVAKLADPYRLQVGFHQEKCTCHKGYDPCQEACSLALNPKTLANIWETECNNCGDCVVVCKKMGQALTLGFGAAAVRSRMMEKEGNKSQASPMSGEMDRGSKALQKEK